MLLFIPIMQYGLQHILNNSHATFNIFLVNLSIKQLEILMHYHIEDTYAIFSCRDR
uniref:Uncharacterized protein n=1 Tax=Anguilla anguilla TaxID=7936 RepID=A0A0E9Q5T9_ANGAN